MQDSYTIKQFSGYQIDGIVRITHDAKVLILTRDKKGIQHSTTIQPVANKFGFFVDLPVISAKGKLKNVPFELRELYEFAFPNRPLPELLTTSPRKSLDKPLNAEQQQDLF